jgi:hypothetical protein
VNAPRAVVFRGHPRCTLGRISEGADRYDNHGRRAYYRGWDHDYPQERGLHDPEQPTYGRREGQDGVELTCQPPRRTLYGVERALKIELPEDFLLPFEWAQETDWLYRVFRVPASLLNQTLKYGDGRNHKTGSTTLMRVDVETESEHGILGRPTCTSRPSSVALAFFCRSHLINLARE